jgi:hypothetical protein
VNVNGTAGIRGSIQLVASTSSPEVSSVLRVISHHIPIPWRKSSRRSSPLDISRDADSRWSDSDTVPFREAPGSRLPLERRGQAGRHLSTTYAFGSVDATAVSPGRAAARDWLWLLGPVAGSSDVDAAKRLAQRRLAHQERRQGRDRPLDVTGWFCAE